jgi:prepilin-type N-terminal cleavage/methylation domain-containing protein
MKFRQQGYTLIELLMVVSLTSIALATVGVMLHGVFRAQRSMSDHTQFIEHFSRLAEQFRNDVHRSPSVEPTGRSCNFATPEGTQIEYRIDTDGVSRIVRTGNQVLQRDTHFLPTEFTGTWKLDSTGTGSKPIASLLIALLPRDKPEPSSDEKQFRIDAVVGLTPQEIRVAEGEK